jgi:hypothetical protein
VLVEHAEKKKEERGSVGAAVEREGGGFSLGCATRREELGWCSTRLARDGWPSMAWPRRTWMCCQRRTREGRSR